MNAVATIDHGAWSMEHGRTIPTIIEAPCQSRLRSTDHILVRI